MAAGFVGTPPGDFYHSTPSEVVTKESFKRETKVGVQILYDVEVLHGKLLLRVSNCHYVATVGT